MSTLLLQCSGQLLIEAPAHCILAFALLFRAIPTGPFRSLDLEQALPFASRAAEIDDSDPWAHLAMGWAALLMRRTDTAVEEYQRALSINPNLAAAHGHLGMAYGLNDQPDKAIAHLEQVNPSILDEAIWSLTSPGVKHISGSKNFRLAIPKGLLQQYPPTRDIGGISHGLAHGFARKQR